MPGSEQILLQIFRRGVAAVLPQNIFRHREIVRVVPDKEIVLVAENLQSSSIIQLPRQVHIISIGKAFMCALELGRLFSNPSCILSVPVLNRFYPHSKCPGGRSAII